MNAVGKLAWAALLVGAPLAAADGRPPLTNGVHFKPGDPHSLYVATTFGLLISHDDGCTFRWVCEQSIGYAGQFDPKYRIAEDGSIFATTFTGLRISRDRGCTFTTATADRPRADPGRIADMWIDAIDVGPTGEVWVATADSGKPNNVYRSTDNGLTFEPRGLQSPTIWWKSVAIAPTRAQRVYITGYKVAGAATTQFEITDDGGTHWTESRLTGVRYGSTPLVYAVGVDKTNPEVVYMTSIGANPPSGDRLYRSMDGGMTWMGVLATTDPIRDTVVEPGGGVLVATLAGGSFRSSNGIAFSRMATPPQLACLGQRSDGTLYGCGANWQPDFKAVAKSGDAVSWQQVFRFVDLAGPLDCPAGTAEHDTCGPQWPTIQQQFGATGPTCNAPADAPPVVTKPTSGGCCDAVAPPGSAGLIVMVVVLALRRRRR